MKALRLKTHHFYTKLPYQKPMLRQLEWWVQNGSIAKDGVLSVTTSLFWKFCFILRTSFKELIWCTNWPNAHIRTFCMRCSLIWRCLFYCEYPWNVFLNELLDVIFEISRDHARFYDSLIEKTNCYITVVFGSCFSFYLLPPWFH